MYLISDEETEEERPLSREVELGWYDVWWNTTLVRKLPRRFINHRKIIVGKET